MVVPPAISTAQVGIEHARELQASKNCRPKPRSNMKCAVLATLGVRLLLGRAAHVVHHVVVSAI